MVAANRDRSEIDKVTFVRETDLPPTELPETVIDRYAKWASTATDAPEQYHRLSGAIILSTILAPHISLDTSFGVIRPNLWGMILAGTTLTRKSTSMNLAKKMLDDVTDDYMLATDGSPEGIFSELAARTDQVSMFHRDEVTGFISAITGKDYLSGLLESFTQLYDGTEQKRVLRGQSIVVKNPYFIFYCGGIKTRMEELVGMEHIRSGFLPRFLFITGSTSVDEVRPIGPPPTEEQLRDGSAPRDKIVEELWHINKFYKDASMNQPKPLSVKVGGMIRMQAPVSNSGPVHHKLQADSGGWKRIRELHYDAMRLGEASSAPELYTPMFARLADSVVKVSMLIAAAERKFVIESVHVQKAASLAQEWLESLIDFTAKIEEAPEMDKHEKKLDKIVTFVRSKHPEEVSRTSVMQKFRIRRKDMQDIEETLRDRRMIEIVRERFKDGNTRNTLDGYRVFYTVPKGQIVTASGDTPRSPIEREDSYVSKGSRDSARRGKSGKRYRLSQLSRKQDNRYSEAEQILGGIDPTDPEYLSQLEGEEDPSTK